MLAKSVLFGTRYACQLFSYGLGMLAIFSKGDPLVSLDFFENPMAHPRMKVQVLGSLKLPLAKKNFGEKSVGKHDF